MLKRAKLFRLSLLFNLILIIILGAIGYKLRGKIFSSFIKSTPKQYTVVMVGTGYTHEADWNKILNRNDILNSGYSGFTTSQLDWILNDIAIKYHPKTCFLGSGLNDIQVGIPLSRTFANYESLVNNLLKNNIEPVLQGTFYIDYPSGETTNFPNAQLTKLYNSKIDSLNGFLSNLAKQKGIPYIDLNQILTEKRKLNNNVSMDGVHLNEVGYKIWASEIDRILKSKELWNKD